MNVLDQIRIEKSQMNRIRYVVNYVIAPIYLMIVLVGLIAATVLMSIDEIRYLPLFVAIMVAFVILTIVLLASVPYVRKIEISAEIKKHDYDLAGVAFNDGKYVLDIDEDLHVEFAIYGIQLNTNDFAYYDFTIRINTSNKYNLVNVLVDFSLKHNRTMEIDENKAVSGFYLELNKDLLYAIEKFDIPIENRSALDYILNNQATAFTQIYKLGHIKDAGS